MKCFTEYVCNEYIHSNFSYYAYILAEFHRTDKEGNLKYRNLEINTGAVSYWKKKPNQTSNLTKRKQTNHSTRNSTPQQNICSKWYR